MFAEPRKITTNQVAPHEDLLSVVQKYKKSDNLKPIAQHTKAAFDQTIDWLADWQGEVILDACCGVGESTLHLASMHTDKRIIGIDKSALRLNKNQHYEKGFVDYSSNTQNNHLILQADLEDFWRLLADYLPQVKWNVVSQYLLYPNPYPKKSQLQKRWHASASFKSMIACGEKWEVRSNWRLYLEEFQLALQAYNIQSDIHEITTSPITPFERKYLGGGQKCWRLVTR